MFINSSNDVLKFYETLHLEHEKLCRIGQHKFGLSRSAIEIAMNTLYSQRDFYPKISLGHRVWLISKRLEPLMDDWKKRPWWKRLYQSIVFPSTTIWEFDKWRTLRN